MSGIMLQDQSKTNINTNGGAYVRKGVNIKNCDFVGRDQIKVTVITEAAAQIQARQKQQHAL